MCFSRFSMSSISAPRVVATGSVLVLALLLLTGCAGSRLAEQEQAITELRTSNDELLDRIAVLRDSLQFYEDIDSGQYHRDRRVLLDRINQLQYRLAIASDGGTTADVLLVDDLFAPASAELSTGGRVRLDTLAALLADDFVGQPVRIEAHSDNVPIGPSLIDQYPSNWELSTARAAAVVRYLVENHGFDADRLEAVGFGATRPRATNATAEGRKRNRRVRVAVLPGGRGGQDEEATGSF